MDNVVSDSIVSPEKLKTSLAEKGFNVSYNKTLRSLSSARQLTYGNCDSSFSKLMDLKAELQLQNDEAIFSVETQLNGTFKRLFFALQQSIVGHEFCLPIIGLDGTHIKTKMGGVVLIATSLDPNGQCYPLCFDVVSVENEINWTEFLTDMNTFFQIKPGTTIISDRHKGLINAVDTVFGDSVYHCYCLNHISDNLLKKGGKKAVDLFWKVATSNNVQEFQMLMNRMQSECNRAWMLLSDLPTKHWADLFIEGERYGHYTNNISESINAWINDARKLPITQMITNIINQLSDWFKERRHYGEKMIGEFVDKVEEEIKRHQIIGRQFAMEEIDPDRMYKIEQHHISYNVDLENEQCSCFEWQKRKIPCIHAISVLRRKNTSIRRKISRVYEASYYRKCYMKQVNKLRNPIYWQTVSEGNVDVILPPESRRMPGRPSNRERVRLGQQRFDGQNVRRLYRCSLCRQQGHSKKNCLLNEEEVM
ncbi:hypothetical protein RCL1_005895 [Eukaryota sp. TZLM3-RCL]